MSVMLRLPCEALRTSATPFGSELQLSPASSGVDQHRDCVRASTSYRIPFPIDGGLPQPTARLSAAGRTSARHLASTEMQTSDAILARQLEQQSPPKSDQCLLQAPERFSLDSFSPRLLYPAY